jgi:hypothetical protein
MREETVLERDLKLLLANIATVLQQRPPADDWLAAKKIARLLRLDLCHRIMLGKLLRILRERGSVGHMQLVRTVGGRVKQRNVWHYNFAEFSSFLGDRTVAAALKDLGGKGDTPEIASREESAPSGLPGPQAANDVRRGGRPLSAETQAVYKFCYEERQKVGDPVVMRRANAKFKKQVIKDVRHVWLYAKRYADRKGLPMS